MGSEPTTAEWDDYQVVLERLLVVRRENAKREHDAQAEVFKAAKAIAAANKTKREKVDIMPATPAVLDAFDRATARERAEREKAEPPAPPDEWQVGDELECNFDNDEPPVRGLLVAQDSEGYSVRLPDDTLNYFDRHLTTWLSRPPLVKGQAVRT